MSVVLFFNQCICRLCLLTSCQPTGQYLVNVRFSRRSKYPNLRTRSHAGEYGHAWLPRGSRGRGRVAFDVGSVVGDCNVDLVIAA